MTEWGNMSEVGWKKVGLVVFDLDGTLYDQPPLRRAMAIELCKHSLRQRSLRTVRTLRAFRQIRELLGEVQGDDFTHEQFSLTSRRCGCSEGEIRAMVEEWIERRPLALLPRYKARGIDRLFSALRATGRRIAVWSDYPVDAKLAALGLRCDHTIWSGSGGVGRLKPNPAGLLALLAETGMTPGETLVIGDRADRDAAAAAAIGVPALIRTHGKTAEPSGFRRFDDPPFKAILAEGAHA
ncbi:MULTISPECIES: HAD family hydrolase [unclassified Novosphingobium]|uniref:HAD family hydrolase n=1 Tax=unclassified Novosphingobium TaxID=2644732 RepID=UPI0010534794|nr:MULTISPECIES: HAD family hydrolase [unclassified Novosphingobium]MPS66883.1 HAD family hydrolase [Novosphingobium sp.]TCM37079.1 phosphoglycolate phosphatase/putative hydrolase of the HAD superfamily [Novosphingobium sp. ST904]